MQLTAERLEVGRFAWGGDWCVHVYMCMRLLAKAFGSGYV